RLELAAQVVGDGDDRDGAAHDPARRAADAADRAYVPDVLAVSGDDERCVGGQRRDQARRDEEMGIDDVGAPPTRRGAGVPEELEVAAPAPGAPVEHGQVELVPPLAQRELEIPDEDAE